MAGPTLLDLGVITDEVQATDVGYLVRGVGAGRDKQFTMNLVVPTILTQNTTTAINLNTYKGDLVIFSTPAADITLTFSNMLPNGRKLVIVNKATGFDVILAGTYVGIVHPTDDVFRLYSDGTNLFKEAVTLNTNVVTSANYVILDTDGYDNIEVSTAAADRTITLPTLADNIGREITVVKTDAGVGEVIVDGEGAETINGIITVRLISQNDIIKIYAESSEWKIKNVSSTNSKVFNATGTYNVPAGIDRAIVTIWGAGGGGGGGDQTTAGGGGGSGEIFYRKSIVVTPSSAITVTIGTGGAGSSGGTGGVGGNSTFGALITALGGSPGINGAHGNGGNGGGNLGGDGGSAVGGDDGNTGIGQGYILGGAGGGECGAAGAANNGGNGADLLEYTGGVGGAGADTESGGGGGGAGINANGGDGDDAGVGNPGDGAVNSGGGGGGGAERSTPGLTTGGDGGSGGCIVEWMD